ncbi:uncharacterized sodium-dependent transporter HI_0736-like [Ptychodera flava]|uniref:uncharacterized sodium-dependent transporter HI_0736-like n=1 Tax=Ptychodera flava TaxID=63121 RepID=UPI00396A9C34
MENSTPSETEPLLAGTRDNEAKEETPGEDSPHGTFKYRFGMILSCIGCMVGTGNIWRFPRIAANNAGDNGALQFLLVWIMFLFLWSIPMIVIEYAVGRYAKKTPVQIYRDFIGPRNMWCGGWILVVDLGITCYYTVVLGWCFYYFYYTAAHVLPEEEQISQKIFDNYAKESSIPLVTHAVAISLAGIVVLWGVKSIEVFNSFVVPIFLLIILVTFIWSLTLPHAGEGVKFLFTPDWGEFGNANLWIDAASQNAWDTGAGMGLFVAYSGYMTARNGIVRFSNVIPLCNNLVSLVCGMMTFATVFSVQTEMGANKTQIVELLRDSGEANTGLTFIWLPILYSTMDGGRVLAVFFFLALSFAGLSSLVANVELIAKSLVDFGMSRKVSVLVVVVFVFGFGSISALDMSFLINQDFVWSFALIISGVMFQYLVLRYGTSLFRAKLINEYSIDDWYLPKVWEWVIKFIAPIEAAALLIWFAVNQILENPDDWYKMGEETLMTCLVQWLGAMIILNIVNLLYVFCYLPRRTPYENLDLAEKDEDSYPTENARRIISSSEYEVEESKH